MDFFRQLYLMAIKMKKVLVSIDPDAAVIEYEEADLTSFAMMLPLLVMKGRSTRVFPPLKALNNLFEQEVMNCGMTGLVYWRGFQIDEAAYVALRQAFFKELNLDYQIYAELENISTFNDWCGQTLKYFKKRKGG